MVAELNVIALPTQLHSTWSDFEVAAWMQLPAHTKYFQIYNCLRWWLRRESQKIGDTPGDDLCRLIVSAHKDWKRLRAAGKHQVVHAFFRCVPSI